MASPGGTLKDHGGGRRRRRRRRRRRGAANLRQDSE
jgi:hypothetical protein